MEARLLAKDITVTFGGVEVVSEVDLELAPGEIHALVGENGAGKSSLAKVIGGVYQPRFGSLVLNGRPIRCKNPREALAHGIALIHQEPPSFPDLDITENIFVGHHPGRAGLVGWRVARERANGILDELGVGLDPRAKVGGLSVAQQQMVELAAAMSHEASVWLFDETTAPLTPKEVDELFAVMDKLKKQGCALLMVTHHLEEVFAVADRITVMRDGRKVAETVPKDTSIKEIVRLMVGRELSAEKLLAAPSGTLGEDKCVLELRSLTGEGFRDLNLKLYAGEVAGLAGLVGAGRTELARALFGITRVRSGEILLSAESTQALRGPQPETLRASALSRVASPLSPIVALRLGIALLPEDRQQDGLLMPQSISFNATLAHLRKLSSGGWLNRKRILESSKTFAQRLNLSHRSQDQPVAQLSGGNQQKVVLSKWLMTQPRVLILDEPTRGVDVGAKHEVHVLIRELAKQGVAVLMISSDLPEVLAVSDRIVVMREGRVAAEIPSGATQEQVMLAATGALVS